MLNTAMSDVPVTKGLHSFTSQLNLSAFFWDRGCA